MPAAKSLPAAVRLHGRQVPWALGPAAAGLVLALAGCGRAAPAPGGSSGSPGARSYTVRGVIVRLPEAGGASREILIRHEAIPNFVNSAGQETGMPGMTMPFPVGGALSLRGLAPGQLVEFTFRVDWQASPPLELTAIRALSSPSAAKEG